MKVSVKKAAREKLVVDKSAISKQTKRKKLVKKGTRKNSDSSSISKIEYNEAALSDVESDSKSINEQSFDESEAENVENGIESYDEVDSDSVENYAESFNAETDADGIENHEVNSEAELKNDRNNSDEDDNLASSKSKLLGNPQWADAMAKILNSNKPKNKKTLVLSRAKKLTDVKKEKKTDLDLDLDLDFEVIPNEQEKMKESAEELDEKKLDIKKAFLIKEHHMRGRIKPSVLDKDREKILSKIATRGVVQLFNVVRQQQKTIDYKLKKAGRSRKRREQTLKSIDKRESLDQMTSSIKSTCINEISKNRKGDVENDDRTTWDVLKENFMMGNKFKNWDKAENVNVEEINNTDHSE